MTHLFIIFALTLNLTNGATYRTGILQILPVASKEQCDVLKKAFDNPPGRRKGFYWRTNGDFLTEATCMSIEESPAPIVDTKPACWSNYDDDCIRRWEGGWNTALPKKGDVKDGLVFLNGEWRHCLDRNMKTVACRAGGAR